MLKTLFAYTNHIKLGALLYLLSAFAIVPQAAAGSRQEAAIQHAPEDVAAFSKGLEKYAAAQGARAFILARKGRPQKDLPKGVWYTHTAIAIYSNVQLSTGEIVQSYAIHNLYQNPENSAQSQLIVDYPIDFFWGAYALEAGIIIPNPQVQQALVELIANNQHTLLHNPRYSVLANPFNNEYQNCTEFTLDIVNAAIYNSTQIPQLKANARSHFIPQTIKMSRFKLFLGAALMDDVSIKDHKGKVKTATFTSIANYMKQFQLASTVVVLDSELKVTQAKPR